VPRATLIAMTALPLQPARLLTVDEFAALPEAPEGRYELQEGRLVMSPSPVPRHQRCQHRLQVQLDPQLPPGLGLLPAVDIDLGLAAPTEPGFVRIPDLAVVSEAEYERVDREGGLLRAAHVRLVIEILSAGSQRTDRVIKHGEYADAGIEHYWILDLLDGPSHTACHLGGAFGYMDAPPVTGVFTTDLPFPVRLDLNRLG
jgi:Uma2 family endonuclease